MHISIITILLALLYFGIGAAWYSPILFGKPWQKEVKLSPSKNKSMLLPIGISFICMLILVFGMAHFFCHITSTHWSTYAKKSLLVALFIAVPVLTINHVYEGKSLKLWLINAGYVVVGFTGIGLLYNVLA